jgi:hypothetical protein
MQPLTNRLRAREAKTAGLTNQELAKRQAALARMQEQFESQEKKKLIASSWRQPWFSTQSLAEAQQRATPSTLQAHKLAQHQHLRPSILRRLQRANEQVHALRNAILARSQAHQTEIAGLNAQLASRQDAVTRSDAKKKKYESSSSRFPP